MACRPSWVAGPGLLLLLGLPRDGCCPGLAGLLLLELGRAGLLGGLGLLLLGMGLGWGCMLLRVEVGLLRVGVEVLRAKPIACRQWLLGHPVGRTAV